MMFSWGRLWYLPMLSTPEHSYKEKTRFKKTLLKKGCSVGANATIVCGVTIGEYALIGSGAVVNKDVKPYALMVGVPAKTDRLGRYFWKYINLS